MSDLPTSPAIRARKLATRRLKSRIKDWIGPRAYRAESYAQEGEDRILRRIFEDQRDGFYVDVGCHHPFRFSNTYLFYRLGWRGLCIDALPGTQAQFNRHRPRDVAVELGIGETPSTLTYHMFNEPALNTFSADLASQREGQNNWHVIERRRIEVVPLADALARHLPSSVHEIDFMSVDVEGLDLPVLRSNDWQRFRPRIVVTECYGSAPSRWADDPVVRFMAQCNYYPVAKAVHSVFFRRDSEELFP